MAKDPNRPMLTVMDLARLDVGSIQKYRNYFIERTAAGWTTVREDDPTRRHSFQSSEAALIWIEVNRRHLGRTPYLSAERLEELYFGVSNLKPGQYLTFPGFVVWRLIYGWAVEDVRQGGIVATTVPGLLFHKLDHRLSWAEPHEKRMNEAKP